MDEGIDFVGGRTYTVRFDKDMNSEEVKKSTDLIFGSSEIKTIGGPNQLKISTKFKIDDNSPSADDEAQLLLFESLKDFLPKSISTIDGDKEYTYQHFLNAENEIGKMMSGKVSPTIADDIKNSSIWAILFVELTFINFFKKILNQFCLNINSCSRVI